jgi:hypothetical protein
MEPRWQEPEQPSDLLRDQAARSPSRAMKIKSKRKAGETGSTNCGSETSLMGFAEAYLTETKNAAPGRVGLKTRY